MAEILYDSEIVTLSYDVNDQLIEMVWKKNTHSDEYRRLFNKIIEFSENNRIRHVLSDMRKEGLVATEDVRWMDREVLKRAIEHKLEKIALVIDDTIFTGVYSDVVKKKLDKSPVQVRVFMDMSNARAWLAGD